MVTTPTPRVASCSNTYKPSPATAANRDILRTPRPIATNSTTSTQLAFGTIPSNTKRLVKPAMRKLAHIARYAAVRAPTSSDTSGHRSSRKREVVLGVEGDRPKVCIKPPFLRDQIPRTNHPNTRGLTRQVYSHLSKSDAELRRKPLAESRRSSYSGLRAKATMFEPAATATYWRPPAR